MSSLNSHGVYCSNGDRQGINVCVGEEANRLVDRRVVHVISLGSLTVLGLSNLADLGFDCHAYLVGCFDDLTRDADVLRIWQGRTIEHDGAESGAQTFNTAEEALAVIEVYDYRNGILVGVVTGDHAQLFESGKVGTALRDLQDHGRFHLIRCFDDSLGILQVVDVVRTDRVVVLECVLCDFFQRYQHCHHLQVVRRP